MNYAELNISAKTVKEIQALLLDTKQFPKSDDWANSKWVRLENVAELEQVNKEWHDYFCKRNDEYPCLRIINGLRKQVEDYRRWLNEVQKSEYEGLRHSKFLEIKSKMGLETSLACLVLPVALR